MSVRSSIAWSLLQRQITLALSFGATMIVSRLITPAELGVFLMAAGVLHIAGAISELGVGAYIIQETRLTRSRIKTAFGLILLSSWAMAAAIYAGSGLAAEFFRHEGVREVLTVTALTFLVVPFNTPAVGLLQREMRFKALTVIGVTGGVANAVTAVVLAYLGYSYMALAWAALAQQIAITLAAFMVRPADSWMLPSLREWRRVGDVVGSLTLASVASQAAAMAPALVIGRIIGVEAAGLYGRGRTVYDLFGRSITRGIRPVFLPAFARARREGGSLLDALGQGFMNFAAVAWPFFLVLGLVPGSTVRLLFGAHWDPAAPVLQILCIAGFTIPFTAFVSDVLIACGRVRLHMVLQVALKLALVVLVIFGARISLESVAYAVVAAEFLRVAIGVAALHNSIDIDWQYFARAMGLNAFVALATAAGPLLLVSFTQLPDVEMLALVALSAAVGWLAAVFATGHPVGKEFNRLALRLRGGTL